MAIQSTYDAFNPKEANVEPGNYLKLFDSISQYQTESGLGVALKGMANLLDKGLDAANALILNEGRNQAETKIEPIVEDYTRNLEDARDYVKAKTRPIASQEYSTNLLPGPEGGSPAGTPIQAADMPDSSLTARAEATPEGIQEADKYIDTLKAGSLQGKISDTYFRGAVANAAKDIRNQFPIGYRAEIDQMISAKMHTVQANPYIESLIHDINTSLTTGKQEKNATLGFIRTHFGVPGADKVFDDRMNDRISDTEAMYRMAPGIQEDYKIKQMKAQLELNGEQLKQDTQLAEKNVNAIAASNAMIFQSSQTTAVGVTPQKLEELAIAAANGTQTLDATKANFYAGQAEAVRQALYNKTLADLREIRTDKNGKKWSYESVTSPEFVMNAAKKVSEHWADVRDSFQKGDLSAATFQTRVMGAAEADAQFKVMFDHPEAAQTLAIAKLLKDHSVPEQLIYESLPKTGQAKVSALVTNAKLQIALPEELKGAMPEGGNPLNSTFKGQLERMKAVYEANGLKGDYSPESITEFTKIIDGKKGVSLVNSDDPSMVNTIAHHVFGPGNENAFKYFSQNMYDSKGRLVPGAQALFNRFSSEDVVNKIMKYGTAQTKAEYNNFMTITAREDLLREDLPKLKEWTATPNLPFKLGWDTETKRLRVDDNASNATNRAGSPELKVRMNQTVNNINMVLDGLKSIATTAGKKDTDVDAYVLAPIMQSLGDIHDMPGLPESLATMIGNAYAVKRFNEQSQALKDKDTKKKYTGEK